MNASLSSASSATPASSSPEASLASAAPAASSARAPKAADTSATGDAMWGWGGHSSVGGEAHVRPPSDTASAVGLAAFPSMTATDFGEGSLIADRYAIRSPLGSGGMGRVFLAEHVGVGRLVAVKILDRQRSTLAPIVRRFQDEARAANIVDHPSIAAVFDCGVLADGRLYLAMEYVRGVALNDFIRDEAPLEWRRAVALALEVTEGTAAVHRAGLVHRDLKPSNLMIVRHGERERVKILDFGVAANLLTASSADDRLTRPGQLVGTPLYMAPEQTQGAVATPAMDVYAIGVILYEMIRGELPHFDRDPFDLVARKRRLAAPRLVGVPEALADLIADVLAIDPARRPADAGVLAERLRAILHPPAPALAAPPVAVPRRLPWVPLIVAMGLLGSLAALTFGHSRAGPSAAVVDARAEGGDSATRAEEPPSRGGAEAIRAVEAASLAAGGSLDASDAGGASDAGDPGAARGASAASEAVASVEGASTTDAGADSKSMKTASERPHAATDGGQRPGPGGTSGAGGRRSCGLAREAAVEARESHEWPDVLRYTEDAACWPDRETRRSLRVKASYELSKYRECRSEGEGARDRTTRKMVDLCAERLGEG